MEQEKFKMDFIGTKEGLIKALKRHINEIEKEIEAQEKAQ